MNRFFPRLVLPFLVFLLAACASAPIAFGPVEALKTDTGYYADHHIDFDDETLMIVTFSGGGIRAATLAQGVLEALDTVPHEDGTLLDEIDMISSTSGGSVAAANYVLHGRSGFPRFREDFLYQDHMTGLIAETVLNPPLPWSMMVENNRVEPSVRMFETLVTNGATFGDIRPDAPFWIANATDIESGLTFPFTQYQFDILCADLDGFPIARAVAASSAFPAAVSSIVVRNDAPCPAQRDEAGELNRNLIYIEDLQWTESPLRGGDGAAEVERALVASDIMTACDEDVPCRRPAYVHLYDGGIADNLGLGEPLWLLTGAVAPWNRKMRNYTTAVGPDGKLILRTVAVAAVNAASSKPSNIGQTARSPTMLTSVLGFMSSVIDRRSIGLTAQLDALPNILANEQCDEECQTRGEALSATVTALSFKQIVDPVCRAQASALGTNWGLERHETDAVLNLGAALAFQSRPFRKVAGLTDGHPANVQWDKAAQCHLAAACTCLADPEACLPAKIRFQAQCDGEQDRMTRR